MNVFSHRKIIGGYLHFIFRFLLCCVRVYYELAVSHRDPQANIPTMSHYEICWMTRTGQPLSQFITASILCISSSSFSRSSCTLRVSHSLLHGILTNGFKWNKCLLLCHYKSCPIHVICGGRGVNGLERSRTEGEEGKRQSLGQCSGQCQVCLA